MSIASEISRLQTAKADLKTAIEGKGVTVPSNTKLDGYADLVDSIETGGGGGTEDNYWYMLVGDEYGVDGVRVYECHFKVYFHPNNEQSQWSIYGAAGNISTYYKCIWFEYKGESYYVDNLNDGNHTLSKQGSPIFYQGKFMTVSITKNGNDYIFYCMED